MVSRQGAGILVVLFTMLAQSAAGQTTQGAAILEGPSEADLASKPLTLVLRGVPVDAAVSLYSSVGEVEELGPVPGGARRIRFTLPQISYPEVATIVAMTEERTHIAWLRVALLARPKMNIESEPNATVTVRVGDRDFGPVTTDRRGRARVQLAVPPGVKTATMSSKDKVGNQGEEPLALSPPPFSRAWVVCPTESDPRVLLFLLNEDASPAPARAGSLRTNVGSISNLEPIAEGVFFGKFVAPQENVEASSLVVEASTTKGKSRPASCEGPIPRQYPSSIDLQATVARFVAGEAAGPIPLKVTPRFPEGVPRHNLTPELKTNLGTIATPRPNGRGEFEATLVLPDSFDGNRAVKIEASLPGRPDISASTELELVPGATHRLEVATRELALRADGATEAEVLVSAFDRFSNPVFDADIEAEPASDLGAFKKRGDGTYTATFRAPVLYRQESRRLAFSTKRGDVRAYVDVTLEPIARRFIIALKGGYLSNLGELAAPYLASHIHARLPVLDDVFFAGLEGGFYFSSAQLQRTDGSERVEVGVDAVPIMARLGAALPIGLFEIYLGGTAGAISITTSLVSERTGTRQAHELVASGGGFGGMSVSVGPGRAVLEGAYIYAPLSGDVSGNAGGIHGTLGYGLEF